MQGKPMGSGRKNRHLSIFTSLFFKSRNPKPVFPSPWPWPSCKQPRTLSFRLTNDEAEEEAIGKLNNHLASSLEYSTHCPSSSEASDCSVEAAMRAMSSNRLTLDGWNERSLRMNVPFEGSVAVEMESGDLYRDFSVSMREMAEASGEDIKGKEMAWFEEMLAWFLRVNKEVTHEFIIEAYRDLLLDASFKSSSTSCTSTCSSLSNSYVSCLSEIEEVEEDDVEGGNRQISLL